MGNHKLPILKIIAYGAIHQIEVDEGVNLRKILLQHNYSPYTKLTRVVNCGGRGICATCGVWVEEGQSAPEHWHDKLASRFGYPRLSCQITIREDMTIRILDDKIIWGKRDPERTE